MVSLEFRGIIKTATSGASIIVETDDNATTVFSQSGNEEYFFATKILDVRWAARRYLRMINRRGLVAEYYEAYYADEHKVSGLHGTLNITGTLAEREFKSGRSNNQTNLRIGYYSPKLIKVLQPNYVGQLSEEERGLTYEAQAIIAAPVVAMFHRWDILRIQDKQWVVMDEPKLVYDHKGHLEGYELKVWSLKPGIIDF